MQVKEAQLLGILALIAAGIILVCIWTGTGEEQTGTPEKEGENQKEQTDVAEADSVSELSKMLEKLDQGPSGGSLDSGEGSGGAAASVEVGGAAPGDASQSSGSGVGTEGGSAQTEDQSGDSIQEQDNAVSEQIESKEPEEVGLVSGGAAGGGGEAVSYVVKKGDTLAEISRKYYGTSGRWRDILKANRGLISSPTELRPDMKLTIPSPERVNVSSAGGSGSRSGVEELATRTRVSGADVYEVQKGDTLYGIAREHYDDPMAWRDIVEANSDIIDDENRITPGMKLILP